MNAARQSLEIALNQYRGGLVSYLQVTTAQSAALTDERASLERARPPVHRERSAREGDGRWLGCLDAATTVTEVT